MTLQAADVIAYRQRRGMSRKQLAVSAGLTEGKVWRIENKNVIHPDEMQALELLGVIAITMPATTPSEPIVVVAAEPKPVVTAPVLRPTPPPEVDLAALSALVAKTYDKYVSNSELQTFKRCRRKWWLSWHRGLVLRSESPVGVRQVGDRVHRALKYHYVPGGPANPVAMLDALEREITLDRSRLDENTLDDVRMQFEKEADLERIILEGYLQWLQETGSDSEFEVIAPETYLETHLMDYGPTSVAIIGKLDVRVRRKTDGAHLFIDHKVVGEFTTPVRILTIDEQMKHYHLLELLTGDGDGKRTAGAIYNMLRRVKRTSRATPPFYKRVEVYHNPHELTTYRQRIQGEIIDILDVTEALHNGDNPHSVAYPSPRRECTYDCPFLQVCPMFDDGSRVEAALSSLYEERDPLDYYLTEMIEVTE